MIDLSFAIDTMIKRRISERSGVDVEAIDEFEHGPRRRLDFYGSKLIAQRFIVELFDQAQPIRTGQRVDCIEDFPNSHRYAKCSPSGLSGPTDCRLRLSWHGRPVRRECLCVGVLTGLALHTGLPGGFRVWALPRDGGNHKRLGERAIAKRKTSARATSCAHGGMVSAWNAGPPMGICSVTPRALRRTTPLGESLHFEWCLLLRGARVVRPSSSGCTIGRIRNARAIGFGLTAPRTT